MTSDDIPQTSVFTSEEQRALLNLKVRYTEDHDYFSNAEHDRLCFIRWLHETGLAES
jgi:hypothetical protein